LKIVNQSDAILKDLEYYETRVPIKGTPAMTHAIFALLYSRLKNTKKSYQFFRNSYRNNLLTPFGVLAETQFGTNPYFLTGAGGVLQSVIFGFAGL
jgi:trehalose/maltose hydrolase-like predicted phosphorylase